MLIAGRGATSAAATGSAILVVGVAVVAGRRSRVGRRRFPPVVVAGARGNRGIAAEGAGYGTGRGCLSRREGRYGNRKRNAATANPTPGEAMEHGCTAVPLRIGIDQNAADVVPSWGRTEVVGRTLDP